MGTCVYFSSPAFGNINPSLPLIREIVSRGDRVIYYAIDHFKEMIEAAGAEYKSYGSRYPQNVYFTKKQSAYSFREFLYGLAVNMLETYQLVREDLLESLAALNIDYIIHDSYSYLGKKIAAQLGKPCICLIPNYAIHGKSMLTSAEKILRYVFLNEVSSVEVLNNWSNKCEKLLERRFHEGVIDLLDFTLCEEKCNLICSIPELNMFCDDFDATYHFIGSTIGEGQLPKQERRTIYISLGTVLNEEYEFYMQCIQALGSLNYEIEIAIGHNLDIADFGAVPPNVHLYPYAPQIEILKRSSLFITHGGYNSFNEAVYFGVPMLLWPKGNEQFITAETAEKLKIGKVIREKELTAEYLKKNVEEMLFDKSYCDDITTISSVLRKSSSIKHAVDIIMNYAGNLI